VNVALVGSGGTIWKHIKESWGGGTKTTRNVSRGWGGGKQLEKCSYDCFLENGGAPKPEKKKQEAEKMEWKESNSWSRRTKGVVFNNQGKNVWVGRGGTNGQKAKQKILRKLMMGEWGVGPWLKGHNMTDTAVPVEDDKWFKKKAGNSTLQQQSD